MAPPLLESGAKKSSKNHTRKFLHQALRDQKLGDYGYLGTFQRENAQFFTNLNKSGRLKALERLPKKVKTHRFAIFTK